MHLVRAERPQTLRELARALVLDEGHIAVVLEPSIRSDLVAVVEDGYAFAPRRRRDRAAALELAALYDRYRVRIINILLTQPDPQLDDFADAFRLRSEPDEEDE